MARSWLFMSCLVPFTHVSVRHGHCLVRCVWTISMCHTSVVIWPSDLSHGGDRISHMVVIWFWDLSHRGGLTLGSLTVVMGSLIWWWSDPGISHMVVMWPWCLSHSGDLTLGSLTVVMGSLIQSWSDPGISHGGDLTLGFHTAVSRSHETCMVNKQCWRERVCVCVCC